MSIAESFDELAEQNCLPEDLAKVLSSLVNAAFDVFERLVLKAPDLTGSGGVNVTGDIQTGEDL